MAKDTLPAIYGALVELCREKNCEKITITDVAERCGISRKTFYYHFADVSGLFASATDYALEQFSPYFQVENSAIDIISKGFEIINSSIDVIDNVLNSTYVGMVRAKVYDYFEEKLRPFILKGAEGCVYSEADIDSVVALYSVIALGFLSKWFLIKKPIPSIEVIEKQLKMFNNHVPMLIKNVSADEMHLRFDSQNSILDFE